MEGEGGRGVLGGGRGVLGGRGGVVPWGVKKGPWGGISQLQDKKGGGQGRQIMLKHPPGYFKKSEYTKKVVSGRPHRRIRKTPKKPPFSPPGAPPPRPPWEAKKGYFGVLGSRKGQFPLFLQIPGFLHLVFCLYFSPAALLPGLVVYIIMS